MCNELILRMYRAKNDLPKFIDIKEEVSQRFESLTEDEIILIINGKISNLEVTNYVEYLNDKNKNN